MSHRGVVVQRPSGGPARRPSSLAGPAPQRIAAAYSRLEEFARWHQRHPAEPPTLARMQALVRGLGNPHRTYPSIHVTGTNGKGSTATMIAGLLTTSGWRVGRYTSPHLHDLTERVAVNGQTVSEMTLVRALERVVTVARDVAITPTWFEAITAASLWIFAEQAVQVAVIEVGRLGRWDATNVVDGEVAVITNVELDHMDVAGPTRHAIAREKAGIVKRGCTLILGEPDRSLRELFVEQRPRRIITLGQQLALRRRRADECGSLTDLETPWSRHHDVRIRMLGAHQCHNALLAVAAVEAFAAAALPAAAVRTVLGTMQLPARAQIVGREPLVVVDGAHNPAAAAALQVALDEAFPDRRPRILLYASLAERDPAPFLRALAAAEFDAAIVTELPSTRAAAPLALGAAVRSARLPVQVVAPVMLALDTAEKLASRSGIVLATGSLYLAAALTSTDGRP